MVIIKIILHSRSDLTYLQNMIGYVTDSRAIVRGCYGVNPFNPSIAYGQMITVKGYYNQMNSNPLVHIVVSLDGENDNEEVVAQIAPTIAAYFKDKYQLMWCVHEPDELTGHHYHIHILLHSVNLQNGHLFHSGPREMNAFGYFVNGITNDNYRLQFECFKD